MLLPVGSNKRKKVFFWGAQCACRYALKIASLHIHRWRNTVDACVPSEKSQLDTEMDRDDDFLFMRMTRIKKGLYFPPEADQNRCAVALLHDPG